MTSSRASYEGVDSPSHTLLDKSHSEENHGELEKEVDQTRGRKESIVKF